MNFFTIVNCTDLWAAAIADKNSTHLPNSRSSSMAVHNTSTESTEDMKHSPYTRSSSFSAAFSHNVSHNDTSSSKVDSAVSNSWSGSGMCV